MVLVDIPLEIRGDIVFPVVVPAGLDELTHQDPLFSQFILLVIKVDLIDNKNSARL